MWYVVSFDCFSLFLHFLTSLIKLILWLGFSTNQRQAEDMVGKDHRVLLPSSSKNKTKKQTES